MDKPTEVAPGIYLIPTVSQLPPSVGLPEISLGIRTNKGLILFTGCSHAGIEKILEASASVDNHLHLLFGGLHLIQTPDPEIERISNRLARQVEARRHRARPLHGRTGLRHTPEKLWGPIPLCGSRKRR